MAEKELYDRFMESEIGKKIKNLPGGKKWVFVLFNYFFSGIVDQKFNPGNSFLGMIFKHMLDDAASEISKRTINGAPGKPLIPSENPAVKMAFIEMLMKMNPEKAAILINRLVEMNENERRAFIKELEMIVMPENFAKLSELDEETFANLGKISQSKGLTQKGLETTDLLYQHGKKATKKYLLLLFSGIALAFVPFLIMSWVGVETGSRWLIMMGGIWRVIIGVGVSIIFAFIAIPILLFTKGREGPAIYMRAVLGAVLVALSTSLILMITPLTSNTQNIPIFIMCLIIGGIIITVNFNVKPIAWLVGIVFFLTFLSFFLPNKFSEAGRAIHEFDQGSLDLPRFSEL